MKRFLIVPILALSLAGCAGFPDLTKSVLVGGGSITATVQNPVTREQQAAIEASYQLTASAALSYARLRRCKVGEAASVANLCSQWPVVQKLQAYNRVAYKAIVQLRGFMDRNQTISAIGAFNEAQAALSAFKSTAAATKI